MANASGSVTLADYALYSNSPLIQRIAFSLLENSSVLADMPFKTYKSLVANGSRFLAGGLPAVNWRAINDVPSLVKADPTPYQEQAYIMSNNFAVDRKLIEDVNQISDPFAINLEAYFKSVVYDFNNKFINGNHVGGTGADNNSIVGLRARLDQAAVYGIPSEMKISAGAVDISAGSNGDGVLEYIQQALDLMGASDGNGVVMYMNALTRRKLDRAVKKLGTTGGFDVTTDQFQRRVMMYNGAKVATIGRKADQTTEIITSTETNLGVDGSSTMSSIYFAKFGENSLEAWQFDSLENSVVGPYLLTAGGTQQQITVDWAVGLWQQNVRSVARIFDIKVA